MGTEAQVEPQPGGLYLVKVTGARTARGSFREVVPVHRLAYSFGWDDSEVVPPGSSLVEIDLIEQPDGTLMRLTHTGLPNAEQCASHAVDGRPRAETSRGAARAAGKRAADRTERLTFGGKARRLPPRHRSFEAHILTLTLYRPHPVGRIVVILPPA